MGSKNNRITTYCLLNGSNVDISLLESFYHVAQEKGFSHAADKLNVSKGLISRHVRKLEADLNAQLFHRTTRAVSLTEAGQKLYTKAQQIFALADIAQQEVKDLTQDDTGIVRFTAPIELGTLVIKDILPKFKTLCPQATLELNLSGNTLDIEHGEQDIALRSLANISDNLVVKPLGGLKNVLVASPCFIQKNNMQTPRDLLELECITNNRNPNWNSWELKFDNQEFEFIASGKLSTTEYSVAKELALQGFGLTSIPLHIVHENIESGELLEVFEHVNSLHELCIVHASTRLLPKKISIFKKLLVDWFDQHPEFLIH